MPDLRFSATMLDNVNLLGTAGVSSALSSIDISGCDTFTQIVDKLEDGMGYANATIGDSDVLLVSSGTYEWESGVYAAIDSEIFFYKDGVPIYLATVSSSGTADPLKIKDGNLYVAGHHFIFKYLIDSGCLIETEEAYEEPHFDVQPEETVTEEDEDDDDDYDVEQSIREAFETLYDQKYEEEEYPDGIPAEEEEPAVEVPSMPKISSVFGPTAGLVNNGYHTVEDYLRETAEEEEPEEGEILVADEADQYNEEPLFQTQEFGWH